MGQNTDAGTGGNDGGNPGGGKDEPNPVSTTGENNNGFVPVPEHSGTFDLDRPGESGTHGQEVVSNDVEPSQNTTQDTTTTVETVERNIRERAEGVNVEKTLDDSYKDNSLSDADVTRRQEEYKRKFYEQKSQEEEKYAKDNPEYPEDK